MTRTNLIIYAALSVIMGISIWQAFAPYVLHKEELQTIYRESKLLEPAQLKAKIQRSGGKPTLVYGYASWCGPCHSVTPLLVQRIRSGLLDDVQIIFVSLDEKAYDMARYLIEGGYSGAFTPYMMRSLNAALAPLGAKEAGGLPYIAVFNRVGMLEKEHSGAIDETALISMLTSLSRSPARFRL